MTKTKRGAPARKAAQGAAEAINPDDWISYTAAAKLRGVSPQAMSQLVRKDTRGRFRTTEIGGRPFVHREDVENFERLPPGQTPRRDDARA